MHFAYYSCVFFFLSSFLHRSPTSSSCNHSHPTHSSLHHTTCQQHSQLTHTLSATFLLFAHARVFFRSPSLLAFLLLLLSSDTELNPGPAAFTVCTLNIHSILHPLHSAALSDLIDSHNPDLFCLTETWTKPTTTSAELLNCTPRNYFFTSIPRKHSGNNSTTGGGTGFLIREPFTELPTRLPDFSSFESSSITLQLSRSKISV